ncbi:tRNA (guanine-N1)-methyltransferase [Anopheles sinensis]|uniref:tRNA (Guanine-N1)-methyltransferase n=1 Tax=Anopheles sinensis TaxID=74873 RepID=A0A084VIK8_ANOSI|nr:tRNA (guanine-N1)-methyltransferase [Anopheles sinensis]
MPSSSHGSKRMQKTVFAAHSVDVRQSRPGEDSSSDNRELSVAFRSLAGSLFQVASVDRSRNVKRCPQRRKTSEAEGRSETLYPSPSGREQALVPRWEIRHINFACEYRRPKTTPSARKQGKDEKVTLDVNRQT